MVVTFGHAKRSKPQADQYYDVRDLSHDLSRPEADEVVERACKAYKQGQTIAIGCEKGSHRSVVLGERIAKKLGVNVRHLDKPKSKSSNSYSY